MLKQLSLGLLALAAYPTLAAEPAVKLIIKPLLCIVDKGETSCAVTFDIRWKSELATEYCLNDEAQPVPLRCWPRVSSGEHRQERVVAQDFSFWLAPPAGAERVAEAKIEVLRVGSTDRRRERRTRHVWDVL